MAENKAVAVLKDMIQSQGDLVRRNRNAKYSEAEKQEIVGEICYRMANEQTGLRAILQTMDNAPSWNAFYKWIKEDQALQDLLKFTREQQAANAVDLLNAINKALLEGSVDKAQVASFRLVSENCKWLAERLSPQSWGTRQIHTGSDGESDPSFTVRPVSQSVFDAQVEEVTDVS